MPEPVISNTSPLLYLHQIGQLDILFKLYEVILVPQAVEHELAIGKAQGIDVPDLKSLDWIKIQTLSSNVVTLYPIDLGRGEAEVIALGLIYADSVLILDDQLGRRMASLYQIRYTGTLGVLIKAKQQGHLVTIAPLINQLQAQGMWLTQPVIEAALKLAKEVKP